jgi:hypothetical protein
MENRKDMNAGLARSLARLVAAARRARARFALLALGVISGGLVETSAPATLFIEVGDQKILPGTSGQKIAITISNDGEPVEIGAFELLIRVADGGPEAGGFISGPRIDGVDLLTGTPFEDKSFGGQFSSLDNTPQRQFWGVISTTATLGVGTDLLLATVSFDSTGFLSGVWDLSLTGFPGANTRLLDREGNPLEVSIANGTLAVCLGNWAKRRARRGVTSSPEM